jgi:hypothetical protein
MDFRYIGALKSWLVAPIFALLGANVFTIRAPAILLASCALVMIYLVLCRFVPKLPAAATTLFLSCDPAFVLHSRVDHGPIVLMILLKLGAIYSFLRAIQSSSWRFFSLGLLCFALGVWDKLNFLWVVVAMAPALLVYAMPLLRLLRTHAKQVLTSVFVFCSIMGLFYFALIRPVMQQRSPLPLDLKSRWDTTVALYNITMSGSGFLDWVLGHHHAAAFGYSPFWLLPVATVVTSLVFVIVRLTGKNNRQIESEYSGAVFFAILCAAILLQICITPEATGPHHIMVLWPFPYFIVLLAAAMLVRLVPTASKRSLISIFVLGAFFWFANNCYATCTLLSDLKTKCSQILWSDRIYDLADYVNLHGNEYTNILFTDWGIHSPVSALVHRTIRPKCQDDWRLFKNMRPEDHDSESFAASVKQGQTLVVMHSDAGTLFPKTRKHFFEWIAKQKLPCQPLTTFQDKSGQVVYELYDIGPGANH